MSLFELCIRRPVLATVLSLLVLVIGLISYTRLAVREYPKIDEPIVSVQTTYPGASAEVIESQITKVLEDSLAGIEGVELMTSASRSERSDINVRFRITRDPDSAAADVRDKVARVRARLPDGVDEPVIAKVESDAFPIIWMTVTQGARTPLEVSDYLARYVKPRLSVLPGAADVWIFGERRISMRIDVDRDRLAGYRLTVQDVEDALRRQNVELPSGRIESTKREFNIVAATDLQRVGEFENAIVTTFNGYPVRLRDVATVRVGAQSERVIARFNGEPSINMGVVKQATGNPLELSAAVRQEIVKINETLPPGMRITVAYDSSVFIDRSIKSVFTTVAEAVVLVVLVIFFFLRNLRATLIPLVTIPVSLVGAFALMYAFGFTINTLTLLALVLAIGLVVDDAIVVLENIHRRRQAGDDPRQARIEALLDLGGNRLATGKELAQHGKAVADILRLAGLRHKGLLFPRHQVTPDGPDASTSGRPQGIGQILLGRRDLGLNGQRDIGERRLRAAVRSDSGKGPGAALVVHDLSCAIERIHDEAERGRVFRSAGRKDPCAALGHEHERAARAQALAGRHDHLVEPAVDLVDRVAGAFPGHGCQALARLSAQCLHRKTLYLRLQFQQPTAQLRFVGNRAVGPSPIWGCHVTSPSAHHEEPANYSTNDPPAHLQRMIGHIVFLCYNPGTISGWEGASRCLAR